MNFNDWLTAKKPQPPEQMMRKGEEVRMVDGDDETHYVVEDAARGADDWSQTVTLRRLS